MRWVWRNGGMKFVVGENGGNPAKNLPRPRFVHHETHMEWPRRELGTPAVGGERLTPCATRPPLYFKNVRKCVSEIIKFWQWTLLIQNWTKSGPSVPDEVDNIKAVCYIFWQEWWTWRYGGHHLTVQFVVTRDTRTHALVIYAAGKFIAF